MRILVIVLSFLLIVGQAGLFTHEAVYGLDGLSNSSITVLAFTSDVHNNDSQNVRGAERLGSWIDKIYSDYGMIDAMGFCGDMATSNVGTSNESKYWQYTKTAIDVVQERINNNEIRQAVYTTGNHEFENGHFASTNNTVKQYFTVDDTGATGDNYIIYCLGTASNINNIYTAEQITKLAAFLDEADTDKPIIIISHFPLHRCTQGTYGPRSTTNAASVIETLNSAAVSGKKIVFLWGHNHTEKDEHYDQVYGPGDSLEYSTGKYKTAGFYYAAAGCMSDSEYSAGSNFVKGKGLVLTIENNNNDDLTFNYYDANGSDVTEGGPFVEADKIYSVSFDSKGGSQVQGQTVRIGGKATDPGSPETKPTDLGNVDCIKFDGWYSDKQLTNAYDFDRYVRSDLTLYAKWGPDHNLTQHSAKAAECESAGNIEYWTCSKCSGYFSDNKGKNKITEAQIVTNPLNHNWGTPVYTWTADNSEVTAKRTCKNNPGHTETETVETTSVTASETGATTYTAEFTNNAFSKQTKTVGGTSGGGSSGGGSGRSGNAGGSTETEQAAVTEAGNAIASLPSVITLQDKDDVDAALKAFNTLYDEQKALLPAGAVKRLTDAAAAMQVTADIDIIPMEISESSLTSSLASSAEAVKKAREEYDSLTEDQKKMLSPDSVAALEKAEQTVGEWTEYVDNVNSAAAKQTKSAKASAKKGRKVAVSWKKDQSADGYQLQYATNTKFTKNSGKKSTGKSGSKATLSKLKSGKTYYIRVRAITKVTNKATGKTKTVYGKWTKTQKVKTKK